MLIHLPLGLHLLAFLLSSFLLPLVCSYALPEQQYVLSAGKEGEKDGHGILRRFDSRDVDLQDVLQIAEVRHLILHVLLCQDSIEVLRCMYLCATG